ncbi:dihydroxyacetone kinase DhaL subunit [Actinokineospora alba]|uniref:Dihydroxyacetone kinase DhaL subunit n=1 Tax=Actinokineospora alba TaxID=504798 RepID=A0A1H0HNJ1_9PSEU|nr:dihydroxyacetone kinase subunit DhaL [Actinokineospora alba]TDP64820.1 dihydroxyacetone kinase-like protein [Actinokineospora alba]SDH46680.1 dihydroxyacetone kinase, C-terminal domain [Actinokineospora alba]SDO20664.1 dihydroxyacetone kinase DhaL subunit [Actinokineospora alba]
MGCDAGTVAAAIREAAAVITEHRDELVKLDQAIGDGDHGENLKRGFGFVLARLDESTPDTPAAVLKLVATTLISKVGGAAGPLYGTAFLRAATAVGDAAELTPELISTALQAAVDGVVARGKAEVGDKTMVDALTPAAKAQGATVAEVLRAAADAAEAGAESTVPLVARKGRASYLGERSAGHLDPGARSSALLLRSFADSA